MTKEIVKLKAGKYLIKTTITNDGGRNYFNFPYNKPLMAEIKALAGAKWHGYDDVPRKIWSAPENQRNNFRLALMRGEPVYARYDEPIMEYTSSRPLYSHQIEMTAFCLTRRRCIMAGEMGTGKTLVVIEVMEYIKQHEGLEPYEAWYVGPKAGVRAVSRELRKWKSIVNPKMMTYEELTKLVANWNPATPLPKVVIFDESTKIKTPTAKRSQSAAYLVEHMMQDYADPYIIEMTGSPAPKSPIDWWMQCCAGDTLIQTTEGLRRLDNIVGKDITVVVNGKAKKTKGSFKSGIKQLYKVVTKQGYHVRATDDHKFLVNYDGQQLWKELNKLKIGDELVISEPGDYHNWDGVDTFEDGFILGLLVGDGTVIHKEEECAYYGRLKFFEDDFCLLPKVCEILGVSEDRIKVGIDNSGNEYRIINGGKINDLLRYFGLTNKKNITEGMISSSSDFIKGFLSGMFDTDGCAEQSRLRVSLSQTNRHNILAIHKMLQSIGIYSSLSTKQVNRDSTIEGRVIKSKDTNRIVITNQYAVLFNDLVGFSLIHKHERLKLRIKNRHNWITDPKAVITSITKDNIEEVYDITVPDIHAFSANGIVVHNCEIACPGFLKEGHIHSLKARLSIIEERQSISGGAYPHIVTWLDDSNKCAICGEFGDHVNHDPMATVFGGDDSKIHGFKNSINEVHKLYLRLKGLVDIKLKSECLDLPEKQYRVIKVMPTQETLRAAQIIRKTTTRAIGAFTLLRELSDGFQYTEEVVGQQECPECYGEGVIEDDVPIDLDVTKAQKHGDTNYETKEMTCYCCNGKGEVPQYKRATDSYSSPKDQVFIDFLDEYSDLGRFVVWGGFTGTIERLLDIAHQYGWSTLRYDKIVKGSTPDGVDIDPDILLSAMDNGDPNYDKLREEYPKVCFCGHPDAGGLAITLHASPIALYYSNSFKGESRIQSEDRIHRIGMDKNRGATIVDIIHLQTDLVVLENLKNKKRLQNMTMDVMDDAFTSSDINMERYDG